MSTTTDTSLGGFHGKPTARRDRAVVITEPGDVDVLEVADRPAREPSDGEVRIAVKAAGVNPVDITLRRSGLEAAEAHRLVAAGNLRGRAVIVF